LKFYKGKKLFPNWEFYLNNKIETSFYFIDG